MGILLRTLFWKVQMPIYLPFMTSIVEKSRKAFANFTCAWRPTPMTRTCTGMSRYFHSSLISAPASRVRVQPQQFSLCHPVRSNRLCRNSEGCFGGHVDEGFVQRDCAFAGHSLGEYSELASIADVLHISAGADVVF